MLKSALSVITLFALQTISNAQGCSDAGFCTMGNLKHGSNEATNSSQKISFILNNGIGDENVYVFTPGIQYDNQFNKNWSIQAKLTANYASGNLGTISGAGDFIVSGSYSPTTTSLWKSTVLLGTKLPLSNSDIRKDGKSFPMQYQSSLGTTDLIVGFNIANNKWLLATALQQPLTGSNKNSFLTTNWNTVDASKYPSSNNFNRKADVLFRIGYTVKSTNSFQVKAGLLSIYHLGKDTYINSNISNNAIAIAGSSGLTLNGTFGLWYKISSKISLAVNGGAPFIVRDVRPDGLTRKFSIAPELIIKF